MTPGVHPPVISRMPRPGGMRSLPRSAVVALAAAPVLLGAGPGLEAGAFLGEVRIAPGTRYAGTTVGGFSGLDRDHDTWCPDVGGVPDERLLLDVADLPVRSVDNVEGMARTAGTAPAPWCRSAPTTSPRPR